MTFEIAGTILTGRTLGTGAVTVTHDGRIGAEPGGTPRTVRLPVGWIAAPGFVDVQVNGYAGAEVGDDPVQLAAVAAALPRTGVTAFCPTLVTRSPAGYRRAAAALAAVRWPDAGARPLGVHLEGPFLNPVRAGAHRPAHMTTPGAARVAALLRLLRPAIVTLAPELPDAESAIAQIAAAGAVPAVGHTEATPPRRCGPSRPARACSRTPSTRCGVSTAAAPPRSPPSIAHAAAHVSLIGDGAHVAPEVAALTARAPAGAWCGERRIPARRHAAGHGAARRSARAVRWRAHHHAGRPSRGQRRGHRRRPADPGGGGDPPRGGPRRGL